ncbi:hypothetical protein [Zhihengliuella sp.]|uniref:hypothetical protein n=1 Tax=Zhihengliuella sp. TaxID=1954483 RepID=UPI002810EF1B|nr:hypothetical protein [Zhihengliuella sp.]
MSDETTPAPETTGHDAVDRVIDGLAGVPDLPLDEHLAEYEQAHAALQSALDGSEQDHRSALRRVAEGSGLTHDAEDPDAEAGGPAGESA